MKDERKIIGISIARAKPRGRDVVLESIESYLAEKEHSIPVEESEETTIFLDQYICGGYGKYNDAILKTIDHVMKQYGIPLDRTYTGNAFCGMLRYLEEEGITNKNILFIHTGGTPLFFDYLFENYK